MNLAIYVRVSTDRQAEQGASMEDQIAQMTEWAQREGHVVVQTFLEPGASAYEGNRPVFREMIDLALSPEHPIDAILVHQQSRFYRDNTWRSLVERQLAKANVRVLSLTQPSSDDQKTDYLVKNMFGIIDEFLSIQNSENTARCQRRNAMNGFFNGSRPPFGYMTIQTDQPARSGFKKKLVVNAEEAEVVRRIFSLATEGHNGTPIGVKKIATELNEQGFSLRGRRWRKQHVHNILKSPTYTGRYITFRRQSKTKQLRPESEWIVTEIPAIIDQEKFEKANESMKLRGFEMHKSKAELSYTLLTGLIKCNRCNRLMTLMTGKTGRYKYYRCGTKKDISVSACDCPNLPQKLIERAILEYLSEHVIVPERMASMFKALSKAVAAKTKPDRERLMKLQRDSAKLTAQIHVLYDQISNGQIEMNESLRTYIAEHQRRLSTLTREIVVLEKRRRLPLKKFGATQIQAFAEQAKKVFLDPASPYAKAFLKAVVSEIRVSPEKAVISGSPLQLALVVSRWTPGNPNVEVPSLVSDWRARRDSNARPLPSEGSTLSS